MESPTSNLIQNVWELTDYYNSTVLSNESQDLSESPDNEGGVKSNASSQTILSGGHIISYIGSLGGEKKEMGKEQRHLRKYLY